MPKMMIGITNITNSTIISNISQVTNIINVSNVTNNWWQYYINTNIINIAIMANIFDIFDIFNISNNWWDNNWWQQLMTIFSSSPSQASCWCSRASCQTGSRRWRKSTVRQSYRVHAVGRNNLFYFFVFISLLIFLFLFLFSLIFTSIFIFYFSIFLFSYFFLFLFSILFLSWFTFFYYFILFLSLGGYLNSTVGPTSLFDNGDGTTELRPGTGGYFHNSPILKVIYIVQVKTKGQNLFLIFENYHSKLRILVFLV